MKGTLSLTWGKWGGFYRYRARGEYLNTACICCGWVAITYIGGIEIEELMKGYGDAGELERGLREEICRLREPGMFGDPPALPREKRFTADLLERLLTGGIAARDEVVRPFETPRQRKEVP